MFLGTDVNPIRVVSNGKCTTAFDIPQRRSRGNGVVNQAPSPDCDDEIHRGGWISCAGACTPGAFPPHAVVSPSAFSPAWVLVIKVRLHPFSIVANTG